MSLMTRLFGFRGGLHLDYRKEMSTGTPIQIAPVPPQLILPLSQHAGNPAKPRVKVGDRVLRGQTIADADGFVSLPVHAGTSGIVSAIEPRPIPHASGLSAPCIVIDADGKDEALATPEWEPAEDINALDAQTIRDRVRRAGVSGLGGAGFPSFIKLAPGHPVETLIINGAECEPYISCDQLLMAERADEIIGGIQVILHTIRAGRCLIGIEDNKSWAIAALKAAAAADQRIEVVVVPTRYPQGGEKQLIQTLTGLEVPSRGLPLDLGLVVQNPGTARAVWRAIRHAEPLTSRVVTVTGSAVSHPQNFDARIGTPMRFLIDLAGGYTTPPDRLLMGGPMMGFALPTDTLPIVKSTNCILATAPGELRPDEDAMPCIRCGACQDACPINLLPQQMYWHARGKEYDKAQSLNLFDCIECGCCAQVCPSHIPLVQYYRHAKTEIWSEQQEKRKADAARERHEARLARIEREERAKEEARARKKALLAASQAAAKPAAATAPSPVEASASAVGNDDPVARAIAAAKAKKAAAPAADSTSDDPVARAIAAAKAKKAAATSGTAETDDPVARAIAAAKAKKAAANADAAATNTKRAKPSAADDERIAAAVAAAQARKAAKAAAAAQPQATTEADDPVARAIAAAQARKAAQSADASVPAAPQSSSATTGDADDPVARAIAAAQARKAAKAAAVASESPSAPTPATNNTADEDPVARAVAAAKAKKAAKAAAAVAPEPVPAAASETSAQTDDPVARAIAAAKARKAARAAGETPTE
ncbi:electron transport complex subunit RsxC [Sinimarinibacterium sp. CAU 1509]|uniref:electron transport complex subunit RsxC n=1 Tax=Sinimarinibacterium sp. CAU 1509 TaxID=2562283 RepID=UPI0010AD2AF1|nr:electron transport complex subunit RsxC [Sinimarinibacterium sp. CAU 1509]TJY62899.1 electron transport complex subunit RsxC [Sinimarinibacterium sp. CAU 1509]